MARRWTAQQIAQALYAEGLTDAQAAKRFEVAERTIRYWRTGERRPGILRELTRLAEIDRKTADRYVARFRRMAILRAAAGLQAQKTSDDDHRAQAAYVRIILEEYERVSDRTPADSAGIAAELGDLAAAMDALTAPSGPIPPVEPPGEVQGGAGGPAVGQDGTGQTEPGPPPAAP